MDRGRDEPKTTSRRSEAGAIDDLGVDLRLLDSTTHKHPLHYDVISTACCGSCFHGLFDRVRRPVFDQRFREAWDAYTAVNAAFAEAAADAAHPRRHRAGPGLPARARAAQLRAMRPDLRIVHFTHTPFCGPDDIRVLPDDVAAQLSSRSRRPPASTPSAGPRSVRCVRARGVGRRRRAVAPFAASFGPDVAALARGRGQRRRPRGRGRARRRVGDRLVIVRTDRVELSKNIVRGFLAFDAARSPARPARTGVFVAMLYPSCKSCRSTSRTAARSNRPSSVSTSGGRRATGADRGRQARRLPPVGCRAAALRRAPREPCARRAQPRREGRARSSTGVTPRCACHARPAPTKTREGVLPIPSLRHRADARRSRRCIGHPDGHPCDEREPAPWGDLERTPVLWLADLVTHAV